MEGSNQRLAALAQLGEVMRALGAHQPWPGHAIGLSRVEYEGLERAVGRAQRFNGWATEEQVRHAFAAWGEALRPAPIEAWLSRYPEGGASTRAVRNVGLVLAGNVPLVGLHDVLCTWLAGHRARVKCSSQEPELLPAVAQVLDRFAPGAAERITFVEGKLGEVDAVIATGSNNTARYFEHYFGHLPRIVRRNRVSVAVLEGNETEDELAALGEDVFRYFGLGCRNVSKLLIPVDFDVDRLFRAFFPWGGIIQHNKYANNYDYTRALWLLDRVPFLENGFLLLKEDEALASPVAALFFQRVADRAAAERYLEANAAAIQCVVGRGHVPFGRAQHPALWDYADGTDTMRFLFGLP
ncbi:MAG: acyl-CoA reductase [Flavobacteriales bacterium]|jgi:hypothetical protein|nr:MAG: acyl-CoA reductase [Flavobacteriales bacterium]